MSVERLDAAARALLQQEIAAAHGREVSFVVRADPNGTLTGARVVARGTIDSVLALPGVAERGEMLLHNHPSGFLEPSGADLHVAGRLHDEGVGFGIVDNDVATLYVVVECPRARTLARLDYLDVANLLAGQPSPESSSDTDLFRILAANLKKAEPGSTVAAAVSAGTSDSRYFRERGIVAYGIANTVDVARSLAITTPPMRWTAVAPVAPSIP